MKKVKDSRKRWKQLVTMLLVTALLVTGTPDIVGLASEGTQEQVTTAADQSEGTQEEEAISEEPVEQQDTSVQQDTAAKQENTEKNIENRSTAGTTERSENSQNSHEKDKAASGAKSGGSSTSKVRETEKNTKKEDKDTKTEYTYRGSAIQAKVTLKDAEDLSDEADLRVKQTTVANKIKTQIINKAVGEENTQLVDSVRAYDLSFILNGESVTPSGSMQVTLANLGTKSGQNTLIYQVTDDGQVKNTDAVRTGSDAMQFAAKSLCTYVVLTYTTVSDVNGNDITTLYPAMVTATQTQLESKEDGNVPVESWTRTNTPLVLKDTTGKKALAWTWSDIAGIDLSLDNDSQIWNGSRSYGKHTSTALKNGRVTAKSGKLYDSALWKNEGKAGKDTTITRIRGEFTITDKNKNNYAYTLKPVTDSENIYAKDNMFVFVYPKDVELTDDNYMDYLAFWTGSLADAGEKECTFHGRTASNYTQRTPVENVSVLTDGWHMTAASNNAGSIIASTDASDYYVDVISTTDSSNGGMYRFKLVKEKKEKTQFTFRNLDTNAKTGKGGAVFELYKDGVHYSAQSEDEEGRVTFNIVKPEGSDTDVYTLKETKAPEGYDKITTTWKVLVSSEGVTMVKDTEGNEMPKYPDGTYVVSSAKTDEADSTEQTAKTSSVIREYKSDDVNVTVTAENEADLPADAKLVVKPIELSQKAQENVEQAAIKEEKKAIKNILAYDIHFEADGKEVQPGATVKVSVDVPEIKAGANASVFHVDDKNKVENMDGDVDKKGNVVFETTHFSQYVIVNYSKYKEITVTVEHYDSSTENKIYANDKKTLQVGGKIEGYNKATNWTVSKVVVQTGRTTQKYTSGFEKIQLTQDSTVKVYYTANSTSKDGGVKFYDYTVQAGEKDNKKYSINMDANYPDGSEKSKRLSVGESKYNYPDYKYTCKVNNKDANEWTGHPTTGQKPTLVKGLLKGLKSDGSPEFNFNDPGFFKNEDQYYENAGGKKVYTRKVVDDYKLLFNQKGDTYTLQSVKNANGDIQTGVGAGFFPLDNMNLDNKTAKRRDADNLPYEGATDNSISGTHNYYFGMRYDVNFKLGDYVGPLQYTFTGDDDLWVLMDGKVVLDIGGIHDEATETVNLWTKILNKDNSTQDNPTQDEPTQAEINAYINGLSQDEKNENHTITVLYMERGAGVSNCKMNFTLPSAEIVEVTKPKYSFTIHKESTDGKSLAGAKFELTKDNETTPTTVTTASNGYATFLGLAAGGYTLEETQAPSGYEKLMDANGNPIQWTVTVNEQGEVTVKQKGSNTEVGTDAWANYLICNPKAAQLPAPDHQKYIKSNNDDQYKLTLDVTGKVGEADPIDILLIVDKSGSMEGNGVTNVNTAISTLTQTLKDANIRAQVKLAVVTFSGNDNRYGYDGQWNDADLAQNWTDLNSFTWRLNEPRGGTNWQAGIKKGEDVLKTGSGTKKYVVFLTDGNPTFRYDSSGYTEGNGSSDSKGYNYNAAITEWNTSSTLKAATGKYVIDATPNGSENCKTLAQTLSGNAADYLTENYLKGNNEESIKNSFNKIAKAITYASYNNVTITDTLSDYAEFTTKDVNGRPVIKVYKGTKTYTKDTSGTITGIQSVTNKTELEEDTDYEYIYDSSTKTVTVKLNGDLKNGDLKNGELEQNITYWIEFYIKPTEKAYKEYLTNGGYGETKGDLLTDAPENTTSSNKSGFYSNSSAKVTYKVDESNPKSEDYDKPVIQVTPDTTKQVVKKQWFGDAKSSVDVKLTAKVTIGNEEKELFHEKYKSLPEQMQKTLNEDTNWEAEWSNLPTKYYYEDTTNKTIQSADISYSVDEVNVPQGYAKDISNPVSSENGKVITTKITNRQFIIEKVWTDKQSDSHPKEEQEVHPQSQNIVIGIYKPGTDGTEKKPFSTDNLIANVTLNKENSWKATIPSSLGGDYKDYVIRELKEDENGSTIINSKNYSVIEDSANMVVDNASYKVSYSKEDKPEKAYKCIVTNTRLNTITINKVDGNNKPLDGAEFSLEKKDSSNKWEVISTSTKTNENGTLKFSDLEDGEYRITETKSPAGHSLLANSIDVTLPMTLDSTQEGLEKGTGITKEDGKVYYYDLTYTIKNNKLFNMPASGGRFKATLIGIAVMIMAAGCYILRHRRKRII